MKKLFALLAGVVLTLSIQTSFAADKPDFLVDAARYSKVEGRPFKAAEIESALLELIES